MSWWDDDGIGYFFPPPKPGSSQDTGRWKEFRSYDNSHPDIWDSFKQQTFEAWEKGFRKIGAHFIIHLIRWEGTCKVNHNYFPFYARKFMDEYPEKSGVFDLRRMKKDD